MKSHVLIQISYMLTFRLWVRNSLLRVTFERYIISLCFTACWIPVQLFGNKVFGLCRKTLFNAIRILTPIRHYRKYLSIEKTSIVYERTRYNEFKVVHYCFMCNTFCGRKIEVRNTASGMDEPTKCCMLSSHMGNRGKARSCQQYLSKH